MDQNTKDVLMYAIPIAAGIMNLYIMLKFRTMASDIKRVEVATNSMKDALVLATALASKAEGKAEEREEQRVRDLNK